MDTTSAQSFLLTNSKCFDGSVLNIKLDDMSEAQLRALTSLELKDPTTMLLISIFLGALGIDRFMLGQKGMGILKLLTGGLCGILYITDIIHITELTKKCNSDSVREILYW